MAGNNNSNYGRAYGNPQQPQYQIPSYSYLENQRQMPVYSTPHYQVVNDQGPPPPQGYVPVTARPMDRQAYNPYQEMQYQQQYQQQYHMRMNQMTMQANPGSIPSLPTTYQLDGATHRAAEPPLSHPSPYQAERLPMQQQVQPLVPQPGLVQGQPHPRSMTPRQPSNTIPRPASEHRNSATPKAMPVTPVPAPTAHSPQTDLPVDYQVLLLALADEYISKAHGMTAVLVRSMHDDDVVLYHKLMASGLGCLESILRNFRFPDPRMEARLVYRYCSLLFEETENDDIAHEMLIKTIKMCERHRMTDLRYTLIHLQLRFHFRSRPIAALKMLDQLLQNIEAYQHTSWNYAMRFLRVTLSMQMAQPETWSALQQLRRIATVAQGNHHVPILVASAALEALVHLRSDSHEAVQSAQRALAAARMHQLNESIQKIPQLAALLDCLDLCCDLVNLAPDQAIVKMTQMQKIMDAANSSKTWRADGSYSVPVGETADASISADTGGIFERTASGQRALVFMWIRKSELFSLGYLFSGISTAHKNGLDRKAARYLEEGAKINEKYNPSDEQGPQSLNVAQAQCERRAYLHRTMLLHLVLVRCNRSEWTSARSLLEPLVQSLPADIRQESAFTLDMLTIYLDGLTKQGQGDLVGALARYRSPVLALPALTNHNQPAPTSAGGMIQELRLLSALNTVLIIRTDPGQNPQMQSLLYRLEAACQGHPDRSFAAAYNLVHVSSTTKLPITKIKKLLSDAMATAKAVSNSHLVCMTMNLMNATFFRDIVGEQAEKSARVGQSLSKRCANPLWMAVASGMLAGTLEVCGAREESAKAREEGVRHLAGLDEGLREKLMLSQGAAR